MKNQTWKEPERVIPGKGKRMCKVLEIGKTSVFIRKGHGWVFEAQEKPWSSGCQRMLVTASHQLLNPPEDNSFQIFCDQLHSCPVKAGGDVWRISIWDLVVEGGWPWRDGSGRMVGEELGVDNSGWVEPTPGQSQLPTVTLSVSVNPHSGEHIALVLVLRRLLKLCCAVLNGFIISPFFPTGGTWK